MESTDLASTIGTWTAVFLALVALFGILGPWLLWRNLRSERTLAINAIHDPEHQFLSAGVHLWGHARIFRQLRAPNLIDPPQLKATQVFLRKHDQISEPPSRTGWITFAQGLCAFSINFERNGNLVIHDREAWLPVHKLWILAFGLFSRVGRRVDKAQAVNLTNGSRLDHQTPWGDFNDLFGSLGLIKHISPSFPGDLDKIFLMPFGSMLRGNLEPDAIPLSTLFWLFVGCLPLSNSIVYDLHHIQRQYGSLPGSTRYELLDRSEDQSTSKDASENFAVPSFAVPREILRKQLLRFKLLANVVTSSKYSVWASSMGGDMAHVHTLEEIRPQSLDLPEIEHLAESTQKAVTKMGLPSWSMWIGITHHTYIWKSDMQRLALALLLMSVSPRHFLFSRRGDFGFNLLRSASQKDRLFLVETIEKTVGQWKIPIDHQPLVERAKNARNAWLFSGNFSRTSSQAYYDLDVLLWRTYRRRGSSLIWLTIGLMYITSNEFRAFLKLAASDWARAKDYVVEVDMDSNIVRTSSPTHEVTEYRLIFQEVFSAEHLTPRVPKTAVILEMVILAALQAWTRSSWIILRLDSEPLSDLMEFCEEVVYVASSTQPSFRHLSAAHGLQVPWNLLPTPVPLAPPAPPVPTPAPPPPHMPSWDISIPARAANVRFREDFSSESSRRQSPRRQSPRRQSQDLHSRPTLVKRSKSSISRVHSVPSRPRVAAISDLADGSPKRRRSLEFSSPIPSSHYVFLITDREDARGVSVSSLQSQDAPGLWREWDDNLGRIMRQKEWSSRLRALSHEADEDLRVDRATKMHLQTLMRITEATAIESWKPRDAVFYRSPTNAQIEKLGGHDVESDYHGDRRWNLSQVESL